MPKKVKVIFGINLMRVAAAAKVIKRLSGDTLLLSILTITLGIDVKSTVLFR
jgi:hypothetical protein